MNGLEGDTPNGGSLDLPFQCVFRMDQVVDGTPIDVTSEKIISNKGIKCLLRLGQATMSTFNIRFTQMPSVAPTPATALHPLDH